MSAIKKAEEGEVAKYLLKALLAGGLIGGGARMGLGVLRNADPIYNPPDPPKPVIVDIPYQAQHPVPKIPPGPGKEKPEKQPVVEKAALDIEKGIRDLFFSNYTPPQGQPGAPPEEIPLAVGGAALAAAGGLGGGYLLTDKLLRSADRWGAKKDLDDAKKEYQATMLKRLATSRLPAKHAAEDTPVDPVAARTKAALDRAYELTKQAANDPNAGRSLLEMGGVSALAPGFSGLFGPEGARLNALVMAGMGMGGGFLGWRAARDAEAYQKARNAIKHVDRTNAEELPAPVVARLVPMYDKPKPPLPRAAL